MSVSMKLFCNVRDFPGVDAVGTTSVIGLDVRDFGGH